MNNQEMPSISTVNSDTLATLTFSSSITMTVISLALGMVHKNPALATSVAATGQDLNFETRLNAMENTIFKLGSTLQQIIYANDPLVSHEEKMIKYISWYL